jgi:thiamine-phosphate pyrophosphorylase
MSEMFTAGAQRALERALMRAHWRGSSMVEAIDLLAALVDEPESRAASLLAEFGLDPIGVLGALGATPWPDDESELAELPSAPHSPDLRAALSDAAFRARALDRGRGVGTEHLLGGLLALGDDLTRRLREAGLRLAELLAQIGEASHAETTAIPLASDIPPLELAGPAEAVDLGRMLDASANRAREGLRVVEDYVRFALDDPLLTRRFKDVRHRLTEATRALDLDLLIGSRDTRGDVGTHIMTASEQARENPRGVLAANFKRIAEALRSLEEYSKLIDIWLSGRFEVLRYDIYTLEKLTLTAVTAHRSLNEARLYVLVGGLPTLGDLTWVVGEALAGGAQVIQLREKGLPDREILSRAREIRIMTANAQARFILNDRPDLARLAGADGVHLGQEDMRPRDARRVLGPKALLGVSTHHEQQLEQAVLDGAGYLGVGPVFPSGTKDFADLAGLAFVRRAAETTKLPWFAIGGITEENVDEVLEAGAERIAVSAAVVRAERPRQAAASLRAKLDALGTCDEATR